MVTKAVMTMDGVVVKGRSNRMIAKVVSCRNRMAVLLLLLLLLQKVRFHYRWGGRAGQVKGHGSRSGTSRISESHVDRSRRKSVARNMSNRRSQSSRMRSRRARRRMKVDVVHHKRSRGGVAGVGVHELELIMSGASR